MEQLHAIPGATEFLRDKRISAPTNVEDLEACAPGTLGKGYYDFVVENNLTEIRNGLPRFQREVARVW